MSEDILKQILAKIGQMESRMEGMECKMESMESKMEGMESKMEGMESKMEGMESKMEGMESKMEGMESKMEGIESRMEGMESKMEGMESRMGGMESKMEGTESKLGNLEVTAATKSDVETIGQQLSRLENKLDSYHIENIGADEKLLEGVRATSDKIDFYINQSTGELNEFQYSIDVLQRNQFRLDTELEKLKRK